ncbi:exodeoxyribonuclease VII small subunit [Aquihabitans sp. G128]|uniref:exodeoxyribonuclease VII small subunit n=1 Tax=Aquihabitans sp. G128 TaxID=2849779 RepID=UPI001C2462B3|nr:exodeoxyribonuclease VII small subunit [Aquihabitans sp. G128]QXC59551.1 exodeoxyribonuclease VII small subunit [Aquihabitans sp. G128]
MSEPTPVAELGYPEALAELESILDRLEHDEPDVDRVATDVTRAAELVQHCRGRISAARVKVEEVVGGLTPEAADPEADGS